MALFDLQFSKEYYEDVKIGGIFRKKTHVSLFIHRTKISGHAFRLVNGNEGQSLSESRYEIPYEEIAGISCEFINGLECVVVEHKNNAIVVENPAARRKVVLWGLKNPRTIMAEISNAQNSYMDDMEQKRQAHLQAIAEQKEKERKYEEDALTFYQNCYTFHVKTDTPVYVFHERKNEIVALYIASDKSMNFMQINGYRREENVGTIPYDSIHYYEKAGNVSYATDIHSKYSSYGGSFTGASFSKGTATLGGLLCGYMGMIAGALYSYKPVQMSPSTASFSLDSEIVRIDDRSIILNFYSSEKKQYMDIELPQDIYNFLQTHLPEKKYCIVEELERQTAVRSHQPEMNGVPMPAIEPPLIPALNTVVEDHMEVFKCKVEKLRLMKEAGLLTDAEFDEERKKLLAQL